jgi:hypothetical protein
MRRYGLGIQISSPPPLQFLTAGNGRRHNLMAFPPTSYPPPAPMRQDKPNA